MRETEGNILEQNRRGAIDMYTRGLERVQRTKAFFEGLTGDDQDMRVLYLDDKNHYSESAMEPLSIAEAISDLSESESLLQKWIDETSQATDPSALEEEIDSYGSHGGSIYLLESETSVAIPENSIVDIYGGDDFEDIWARNAKM